MSMRRLLLATLLASLAGCHSKETQVPAAPPRPVAGDGGQTVQFPTPRQADYFKTLAVGAANVQAELTAPARVVATVVRSEEGAGQNLVLFDNPDLTANYTELNQHLINIRKIQGVNIVQRKTELARAQDLAANGAATGREVLEARSALASEETNLANEQASLIEHEARLKLGGFDPDALLKARAGTVWVICEIPENQIEKVRQGQTCSLEFTSYPGEAFTGRLEDVGEVVDNVTRLVKVRIVVLGGGARLRAGMYATVRFGLTMGRFITVPNDALVTVQGKNFVFVKTTPTRFERREVTTGQQTADRIVILSGLRPGDQLAVTGAMQLKGLSFGY
jgi:hypothetical protein